MLNTYATSSLSFWSASETTRRITWVSICRSLVTLSALSTKTGIARFQWFDKVSIISSPAFILAALFAKVKGTILPPSAGIMTSQSSLTPPFCCSTKSLKRTFWNLLFIRSVKRLTLVFMNTSQRYIPCSNVSYCCESSFSLASSSLILSVWLAAMAILVFSSSWALISSYSACIFSVKPAAIVSALVALFIAILGNLGGNFGVFFGALEWCWCL